MSAGVGGRRRSPLLLESTRRLTARAPPALPRSDHDTEIGAARAFDIAMIALGRENVVRLRRSPPG